MLTKRDFNISYPPYSLMMIRARLDLLQKTSQVLENLGGLLIRVYPEGPKLN